MAGEVDDGVALFDVPRALREVARWALELTRPRTAGIGRQLVRSVPGAASRPRGDSPPFPHQELGIGHPSRDSGERATDHSTFHPQQRGLCIENAIRGLPDERTDGLDITTFNQNYRPS
jgi:hypothetical protein